MSFGYSELENNNTSIVTTPGAEMPNTLKNELQVCVRMCHHFESAVCISQNLSLCV